MYVNKLVVLKDDKDLQHELFDETRISKVLQILSDIEYKIYVSKRMSYINYELDNIFPLLDVLTYKLSEETEYIASDDKLVINTKRWFHDYEDEDDNIEGSDAKWVYDKLVIPLEYFSMSESEIIKTHKLLVENRIKENVKRGHNNVC